MRYFLKGYYGYRNRGDELLFFGVVKYLMKTYAIELLYVEVEDVQRMESWTKRNREYVSDDSYDKILFIDKTLSHKISFDDMIIVLGGGEVLTDEIVYIATTKEEESTTTPDEAVNDQGAIDIDTIRQSQTPTLRKTLSRFHTASETLKTRGSYVFPRVGRNYYLLYRRAINEGRFILLGGITRAKKPMMHVLYKILLPKAQSIVCRDRESFTLAKSYNSHAILYRDFAYDVFDQYQNNALVGDVSFDDEPYCIVNIHPKHDTRETRAMVTGIVSVYPNHRRYFVIADPSQDTAMYQKACESIPQLQIFDRQEHTVTETLTFMKHAKYVVAARLHVLLVSQYFSVPYTPLIYADKVRKMIDVVHSPLFVSLPLIRTHRSTHWQEKLLAVRVQQGSRAVYAQGDNVEDFAERGALSISHRIVASEPSVYHQQVFTLLKTWGESCKKCVFVVGGDPERFLPVVTYCHSLGILSALVTLTEEQQTRRHAKFPSIAVVLSE